ncbi:major facilitator superfamily MFS_1 [Ferroglobus placidus DSM 10642]|uniref:Major facilitator superfamily MFS_1 n=1 Tax=Ferroglobus placidus (strain DSM 10642 / AEDII12DO) TaxID=589924 RepID=D3RWW2_FERPA|nr:MFS transporter [Ferroglobus placidus]ADC64975.1 major facilitator superfamily MFS_1 [Ferroglobus placidus DSM 10642]
MRKTTIFSITLLPMMIASGMMYSVLPIYIAEELGATKTQVGSLFTLGAMSGAVAAYISGRIADKYGRKPLILISQMSFAAVMLLYSLISDVIFAYPIHLIEGVAWSTLGVSAPTLIADLTRKDERGEAMGVYNSTWSVGWMIGPILGGLLSDLYGFRFMLRVSFLTILTGTVASYIVLKSIKEEIREFSA